MLYFVTFVLIATIPTKEKYTNDIIPIPPTKKKTTKNLDMNIERVKTNTNPYIETMFHMRQGTPKIYYM